MQTKQSGTDFVALSRVGACSSQNLYIRFQLGNEIKRKRERERVKKNNEKLNGKSFFTNFFHSSKSERVSDENRNVSSNGCELK